jgi:hypothetical protein
VARPLVVIGEALRPRAHLALAARDRGLEGRRGVGFDRLVALDHLQQLQHRLVVLVLVRKQQLVDEAVVEQAVLRVVEVDLTQHLEGALADRVHVGLDLSGPQDRQLAAVLAGVLDRVVEAAEVAPQRLAAADPLHQPELLEVGDVAEVPDQGAEDRRVDPVELLLGERVNQL